MKTAEINLSGYYSFSFNIFSHNQASIQGPYSCGSCLCDFKTFSKILILNIFMSSISTIQFSTNGKTYLPPAKPIVVICIDGSADEYLDTTMAFDRMPNLKKMVQNGHRGMVRGALPSFTNVNNS